MAASDITDTRWSFSNYGACVDVYAPGVEVRSAMFYTTTANITATGTSMACPMVSGVSALYAQANPAALPAEVGSPLMCTDLSHCTLAASQLLTSCQLAFLWC